MRNPGKTFLELRNETFFLVGEGRNMARFEDPYGPACRQLTSALNSSPGCVGEEGNRGGAGRREEYLLETIIHLEVRLTAPHTPSAVVSVVSL